MVSSEVKSPCLPSVPIWEGGILGKPRTEVSKVSMKGSNSDGDGAWWGILDELRTKVPKSSMRCSNPGRLGEGVFLVSSELKSLVFHEKFQFGKGGLLYSRIGYSVGFC